MSSENASVSPVASFEKCAVVLLDVQGTTTSINFFKETFFPLVTKSAEEFLKANWEEENVKTAVKELSEKELDLESATKTVVELTESNSDNKGLKVLQGLITKKGYADGELKAHVYDDVPEVLESWAKSRKVAIYSTGDVNCQKQFFINTVKGDLSGHISNYFDQVVGVKTEADSYKKISDELGVKPEEIVFVTDLEEEGKAAKSAGLSVVLVTREGNQELSEDVKKNYPVVNSLAEISFEEKACKRKNTEEAEEPPSKVAKTDEKEKADTEKSKDEEKIEPEEAMEVDSSEKKVEEPKSEEKVAEKEQKSEEKSDAVDSTEESKATKEAVPEAEETKAQEVKPVDKPAENEVDSTSTIEKPETAETTTPEKTETSKPETTENGTVEKEGEKVEEPVSKVEEKASSTTEENGEKPEEKKTEEKVEEKTTEDKEEKTSEKKDKVEESVTTNGTNGDAVPQNGESAKNGDSSETNGKANGTTNGDSKEAEAENVEIKVKKVVPDAESSTEVSVEV